MGILAHWKNVKLKRSSTVEQEIFFFSGLLAVYKDEVFLTDVPVFNFLFSDQKAMTT